MTEVKLKLELKEEHSVQLKDTHGKEIKADEEKKPIYKFNIIFYSITDNFKIIIDKQFSLDILIEEIIPSNKATIINFSKSGIEGILQIKMFLFPLDIYMLDYFFYCSFGTAKNMSNNQYQPQEIHTIADLIANEIIQYDPNANKRQLDSLYFSTAILFLFREASHVSDDILGLIPCGIIYPILFENKQLELKNIFLNEFRDSYIEIIHQSNRVNQLNLVEFSEKENLKESENIKLTKMIKFLHLRTNFFIVKLEKILFEFILKNNLRENLHNDYGIRKGPSSISDIYSIHQFLMRLNHMRGSLSIDLNDKFYQFIVSHCKQAIKALECQQNSKFQRKTSNSYFLTNTSPKKSSASNSSTNPPASNLSTNPPASNSSTNPPDSNLPTNPSTSNSSKTPLGTSLPANSPEQSNPKSCDERKKKSEFSKIFLQVDLSPSWIVNDEDKKDQILTSKKPGFVFFKRKFLLFETEDLSFEIKIPYKIIDSFTDIESPLIKREREKEKDKDIATKFPRRENKEGSDCSISDNRSSMEESSVFIYDGAQLYTFIHVGDKIGKFLTELENHTRKKRSDSFRETLRKSWQKDQVYVLQTESIKRLVKKTGPKVTQILNNLLNPNTYSLSDVIILQNSCIKREDVAIDTLEQLKKVWTSYLYKSGIDEEKLQLIKVTKKIFTERVAVSSRRLFKELMEWVEELQNTYFILVEWTEVGQKANKMYQKMKNYSMINVHQIPLVNATDFFNEQLIKPYLVKYAQMPED